jgi:hypothetical protein
MDAGVSYALRKLAWMGQRRIWPNGLRYLWTDAFGVVLLVSLHERSGTSSTSRRRNGSLRRSSACSAARSASASARSRTATGVRALNRYFERYRSGDAYDTSAITHVMACSSWFPGVLLAPRAR